MDLWAITATNLIYSAAAAPDPNSWVPVIVAIIASLGLGGIAASWVTARFARPKTNADAVKALTDSAVALVNELQERVAEAEVEARSARREAAEARDELRTARRQIRELGDEAEAVTAKLRAVRVALSAPAVSIPGLRAMLGVEPPETTNGHRHG